MFTFLTITYNHEKYIIEHLESIKYQVEKYGKDEAVSLIICDDSSTDNTIFLTEEWLKINKSLFSDATVLQNVSNMGIIKNYFKGVNAVKTENFKCLAGDDLYFLNNIFKIQENYDFIFSHPIIITEEGVNQKSTIRYVDRLDGVKKASDKLEYMEKLLRRGHCRFISAPTVFCTTKILQDEELQKFVGQFKWIEDTPTYYYLFVMKKERKLRILPSDKAYIMYRDTVGISRKKTHKLFKEFSIEQKEMRKQLGMKLFRSIYLNPDFYIDRFYNYRKLFIDNKFIKKSKDEFARLKNEMELADVHYEEIKKKAIDFYEKISFGVKKD